MPPPPPSGQDLPRHGTVTRVFTLFVVFWLWMMPQMLNARAMSDLPDDYGSRSVPSGEEEESKHANLLELVVIGHIPVMPRSTTGRAPHTAERPLCAPHGEVPHPPPWGNA